MCECVLTVTLGAGGRDIQCTCVSVLTVTLVAGGRNIQCVSVC